MVHRFLARTWQPQERSGLGLQAPTCARLGQVGPKSSPSRRRVGLDLDSTWPSRAQVSSPSVFL